MELSIITNEEIKKYIQDNHLDVIWEDNEMVFSIQDNIFLFISTIDKSILIYQDWTLGLSSEEEQILSFRVDIKYVAFKWGDYYYYSSIEELKLIPFKYIGSAKQELQIKYTFLGLHGGYDLCNGSRLYRDWCRKAKFLNIQSLGICEENTLGGLVSFQNACTAKNVNIKPILGITIKVHAIIGYPYYIKLFIANAIGYVNLLRISNKMQIENDGLFIDEDFIIANSSGLCCVLGNDVEINNRFINIYKHKANFKLLYYQIDLIEWDAASRDLEQLNSYKRYFQTYVTEIEPIFLPDSYFLDKEDHSVRKILNAIGKLGFKPQSKQHYFKTLDECFLIWNELFKETDMLLDLFEVSLENSQILSDSCNYKIPTGQAYLPQYILNENEKLKYKDSTELFWSLIEKGLQEKIINKNKNLDIYLERIAEEMEVIELGHFTDYFLIIQDIVSWSASQNIWTGVGRGCFTPESNVKMSDNSWKSIEDIVIGDSVLGRYGPDIVSNVLQYDIDEEIIELYLTEGDIIKCTKDHRILTAAGYKQAQTITDQDILIAVDKIKSWRQIKYNKLKQYKGKVYDLTMTNDPSYNIDMTIVHNSAAGCLISYLLGIVKVDPIEYKLLFTRFLNRGRILKTIKENVYIINDNIEITETDIVTVLRNNKEQELTVTELLEGDNIIKLNGKEV